MNIRPDAKANYRRKGTSDTTYSTRLRIESQTQEVASFFGAYQRQLWLSNFHFLFDVLEEFSAYLQ